MVDGREDRTSLITSLQDRAQVERETLLLFFPAEGKYLFDKVQRA